MERPLISVIIPVYNAEPYLRQCLNSVLSQSLKEIEVICVDDGSTDRSKAIIQDFVQKDARVRLISQNNCHAGVARNRGLEIAKGEYVHFLDADDYVLDEYSSLIETAEANDLDCLKFRAVGIDE